MSCVTGWLGMQVMVAGPVFVTGTWRLRWRTYSTLGGSQLRCMPASTPWCRAREQLSGEWHLRLLLVD